MKQKTEIMKDPYLYILMRDDLESLNTGKAVAQGAHAANQFMFNMERRVDLVDVTKAMYIDWLAQGGGFGVTIISANDAAKSAAR